MLTHHLYTLSKPVNPMYALMCGAVGGALPRLQRTGKDTNNFPPVQVRRFAFRALGGLTGDGGKGEAPAAAAAVGASGYGVEKV